MPSLMDIVTGLGAKRQGKRWVALCPAHNDKTPSLHISEQHGVVFVICRAGCEQKAVISALVDLGLWTTPERPQRPLVDAKELRSAKLWRLGMMHWLSCKLDDPRCGVKGKLEYYLERDMEPPKNIEDACFRFTKQYLWLRKARDLDLVKAYRRQLGKDRKFTNARIGQALHEDDAWRAAFGIVGQRAKVA